MNGAHSSPDYERRRSSAASAGAVTHSSNAHMRAAASVDRLNIMGEGNSGRKLPSMPDSMQRSPMKISGREGEIAALKRSSRRSASSHNLVNNPDGKQLLLCHSFMLLFPSCLLPLFHNLSYEMSLIYRTINMQVKLISTWKVVHQDSFWNRGKRQLSPQASLSKCELVHFIMNEWIPNAVKSVNTVCTCKKLGIISWKRGLRCLDMTQILSYLHVSLVYRNDFDQSKI